MTPSVRTRKNYWRTLIRAEVRKLARRGETIRQELLEWAV